MSRGDWPSTVSYTSKKFFYFYFSTQTCHKVFFLFLVLYFVCEGRCSLFILCSSRSHIIVFICFKLTLKCLFELETTNECNVWNGSETTKWIEQSLSQIIWYHTAGPHRVASSGADWNPFRNQLNRHTFGRFSGAYDRSGTRTAGDPCQPLCWWRRCR